MRFNEVLDRIMYSLKIKDKAHGGSMLGHGGSWRVHDDHPGSMSFKVKIIESWSQKVHFVTI